MQTQQLFFALSDDSADSSNCTNLLANSSMWHPDVQFNRIRKTSFMCKILFPESTICLLQQHTLLTASGADGAPAPSPAASAALSLTGAPGCRALTASQMAVTLSSRGSSSAMLPLLAAGRPAAELPSVSCRLCCWDSASNGTFPCALPAPAAGC